MSYKKEIIHKIINGDCITIMQNMESNSIDVIVADPPYYLQLDKELYRPNNTKVNGVNEDWDKFESFNKYDNFTIMWLKEAQRLLKQGGTIWVMGSYHNIFRVGVILQNLGFWILNDIIWYKSNPMPNFKGVRFNNSHETIIWAKRSAKDKSYYFNYKGMKILNNDVQMQSIWQLPICSGKERIKVNNKSCHPTQKPLNLLKRIILSSTKVGDLILDPFFGTGTTGVAAKELGRNYIGIEINSDYIDIAKHRLSSVENNINIELCKGIEKKKIPRISLGNLIEANLINLGCELFDIKLKYSAKICADGSLLYNDERYSIHKLASIISGSNANGWMFWFYKRNSNLINIDVLRQEYLKKYSIK